MWVARRGRAAKEAEGEMGVAAKAEAGGQVKAGAVEMAKVGAAAAVKAARHKKAQSNQGGTYKSMMIH